jgi:3-deoxy-D-manno-octulosonate 8-phosphate phosphatase KdsC-like HAD superfamily phosphatase
MNQLAALFESKGKSGMIFISDVDGVHTIPRDGAQITASPSKELGAMFTLTEDGRAQSLTVRPVADLAQSRKELVIAGFVESEVMELYRFHTPDGQAVQKLLEHGCRTIIVSGRTAAPVRVRFESTLYYDDNQGVRHRPEVCLGVKDKLAYFSEREIDFKNTIFISDGHQDAPLLQTVSNAGGIAVAPADADTEAKEAADVLTTSKGGGGAFAELARAYLDFLCTR